VRKHSEPGVFNASIGRERVDFIVQRATETNNSRSGVVQEALDLLIDCLKRFGEDYQDALKLQKEPEYIRRLENRLLAAIDNIEFVSVKEQQEIAIDGSLDFEGMVE